MRFAAALLAIAILTVFVRAQTFQVDSPGIRHTGIHPFVEPAFDPGGAGFGRGLDTMAGISVERTHFLFLADGKYDFIRKVDDGAQVPHEKGHYRGAEGYLFWRRGRNYFGAGPRWSETAVTPYKKYAWAPSAGMGHEFGADGLLRVQWMFFREMREYTDYPVEVQFTPGPGQPALAKYCICTSGVVGVDTNFYVRSPASRGHVLFHEDFDIFTFHTSTTDPYDLVLTRQQESTRGITATASFGMTIRF